jgi:hypothetical protein
LDLVSNSVVPYLIASLLPTHITLSYIAAYLEIIQQSLSRIKKSIPSIAFYQMVNGLFLFKQTFVLVNQEIAI